VAIATVSTIPEVVERLRAVEASAPSSDGIVCFTRLYREVTEALAAELALGTFAAPRFLERLDVVFANLFFAALETHARDPASVPRAWAPLFADRRRRGIAPLQFALAGMNAHINRDLPLALVETSRELGVRVRSGSPEHGDYLRVNPVLARVETEVRASYLTGWVARVDRLVHPFRTKLGDAVAMWNVERARDAAWTNGEALWALRADAGLSAEYLRTLDHTIGFAGRGLLVPAETTFARLGRKLRLLG
jgi:hypothetical protein